MLDNISGEWSFLLDLYSGTGALGIEALSRGAEWVDFVEQNARCCAIIRENLHKTGFQDRAHVYRSSVVSALSWLDKKYDVVLMDPPYADLSVGDTLTALVSSSLVGDSSTVVIHHCARQKLPTEVNNFQRVRDRHYGGSYISIYRKGELS
jgi:16S rRNA (guanine966-N2)-methyltransferase